MANARSRVVTAMAIRKLAPSGAPSEPATIRATPPAATAEM